MGNGVDLTDKPSSHLRFNFFHFFSFHRCLFLDPAPVVEPQKFKAINPRNKKNQTK